ncbi:zinc finger protein 534-like isoform X1 [Bacillus rossius redtenbacheri]|uniref:zinc finger protein 534-like isoform X1 n=1 Tax=Bacillus rossius redtenbacheri TaxID=93214 RepID=UPI002FDE0E6D
MAGKELQSFTIPAVSACPSSSEMWHDNDKSVDISNLPHSSFGEHCKINKPDEGLCLGEGRKTEKKPEDVCLAEYSKVENNGKVDENGAKRKSNTGVKLPLDGGITSALEEGVKDGSVSETDCTDIGATNLVNERPQKELSGSKNAKNDSALSPQEELSRENSSGTDTESEVTEVEVRVDPMLFLCTLDDASSDDDDSAEISSRSSGLTSLEENQLQETPPPSQLPAPPPPVPPSVDKETKPYRCSICLRGFNNEIGLQNHLWSHLPSERRVLSTSDSSNHPQRPSPVYSSRGVLHTSSSVVTTTMRFVCPICGKKISTKGNLKVHLETHRPKGKYGCDICGRVFKTQSNLYRHKEYHGGIQFPCAVCGRVYPTNSTLRAHSITHSDLRPHACPLCDKTFKRNQDLKFHINQHTGARPYQCPYCPKAFASSGNCFSHRKRMHPLEVERDRERAAQIMR